MTAEIEPIRPAPLPFNPDDKIFNFTDEEGNSIGEKYSYNDQMKWLKDVSGVNDELLGKA